MNQALHITVKFGSNKKSHNIIENIKITRKEVIVFENLIYTLVKDYTHSF